MKCDITISNSDIKNLILEEDIHFNNPKGFTNKNDIDKLGRINITQQNINGLEINFWESKFKQNTILSEYCKNSTVSMFFNIEGTTESNIENMDKRVLKKGSNNIWILPSGNIGSFHFKKNEIFKSLGISFSEKYIYELTNKHPRIFENIYKKHKNRITNSLMPYDINTNNEMNFVINQIQNSYLMGNTSDLYTEAKVLELISLQINEQNHTQGNTKLACKTVRDKDKIIEARDILISDINKPPSILELAKLVGINDNKLKKAFKEIFNTTIYSYLFEHKMNIAKDMITDNTTPISEISIQCGYDYQSHFSTAFKRKFGISPKEYRNNL